MPRLLIIDDEKANRQYLRMCVESVLGTDWCITAPDTYQDLLMLMLEADKHSFGLILLDGELWEIEGSALRYDWRDISAIVKTLLSENGFIGSISRSSGSLSGMKKAFGESRVVYLGKGRDPEPEKVELFKRTLREAAAQATA